MKPLPQTKSQQTAARAERPWVCTCAVRACVFLVQAR